MAAKKPRLPARSPPESNDRSPGTCLAPIVFCKRLVSGSVGESAASTAGLRAALTLRFTGVLGLIGFLSTTISAFLTYAIALRLIYTSKISQPPFATKSGINAPSIEPAVGSAETITSPNPAARHGSATSSLITTEVCRAQFKSNLHKMRQNRTYKDVASDFLKILDLKNSYDN